MGFAVLTSVMAPLKSLSVPASEPLLSTVMHRAPESLDFRLPRLNSAEVLPVYVVPTPPLLARTRLPVAQASAWLVVCALNAA